MQFKSHLKISGQNIKGFQLRRRNRAQKRISLKNKFDLEIIRVIPDFFNTLTNHALIINPKDTEFILDWIDQNTNGLDQKKFLNNYFANTIENNRRVRNWDSPNIPYILNLPYEKNLFAPLNFGHINMARVEVQIFESAIIQPVNLNQSNENTRRLYRWGQIITSAVFCGGILNKNGLVSILFNPQPKLYKHLVQISLFDENAPRWLLALGQKRTWFIDPISLQLIKQINAEQIKPILYSSLNENISWLIKALNYFFRMTAKANGFSYSEITSLSNWLDHHQTRLALILPPYLHHFSCGRVKSTSLSDHSFLRLTNNKYPGLIHSINSNESDDYSVNALKIDNRHGTEQDALTAEKAFRQALYIRKEEINPSVHSVIAKLNLEIKMHEKNTPEILLALARWTCQKLEVNDRDQSNNGITPSTAYEYFTSLSGGLIEQLGTQPLSTYEIENFIVAYEEILDALNPITSTKLGIAQRLRQFHRYLVVNHNVCPVDFKVLDDDCFISSADANLITNTEYKLILNELDGLCSNRTTKALRAIFILGYRCGLRISEVLNIRFSDLQLDIKSPLARIISAPISLLIRNTRFNDLKTSESRRILPLNLLIPEEELERLLSYVQTEFQDIKINSDRPIFTSDINSSTTMGRPQVYAFLNPLMRQATKDGNIRFHHLRHSFANNLLLGFTCSEERLNLLCNFDWFYIKLKQRLTSENINRRSFLSQIAAWMGHASPDTTIRNYLHVLDFLLLDALYPYSYSIKKRGLGDKAVLFEDMSPAKLLSQLTGLDPDALLRKTNKQITTPQFIANRPIALKDHAACLKTYLPIPKEWTGKEMSIRSFKTIGIKDWISFFEFLIAEKSYKDIFEILEIEQPDITQLERLLLHILKSRKNNRFKQSMLVMRLESRKHILQNSKKEIFLLTAPRGVSAIEVANQAYQHLLKQYGISDILVRDFFRIYITHYNHNFRDIRFKRGEDADYEKFISYTKTLVPDIMKPKIDEERYAHSDRYWKSIKFSPYDNNAPNGESAHALHFAILVAYLITQYIKSTESA